MLREALKAGEFVITCEFVPGRGKNGTSVDAALDFAKSMAATGPKIHAVSLTDNPGGNPAITPDVLAPEVQQYGLEALVHFSCRDFNRNALESRAMALSRVGINNILVVTGDYPSSGFEGRAAAVFDLDCVQAIKYIQAMNSGLEVSGGKKGATVSLPKTDFFVGAGVCPFKYTEREMMPQFFKLEKKVAAGAAFIITQLGYDMRKFLEIKRYMTSRGIMVPLLGNVYVLSYGAAKVMHSGGVPGCVVTDALLKVLEEEAKDADKGKRRRLERAAKMVAMFKGMGFNGVHIGGFALKADDFRFILGRAAELESHWEEFIPDVSFSMEGGFYAFPQPKTYRTNEHDEDPVRHLARGHGSLGYGFSMIMHRLIFERQSLGCKVTTLYYRLIGDRSLMARMSHFYEFCFKLLTFGCKDCGDCALPDMAYCCPQGQCAKQQRNGPCGGSINGMCEVFPEDRKCVWTVVYGRLKSSGRLDDMRDGHYVPARRAELEFTSGWANYFRERDHTQATARGGEGAARAESGNA